MSIQMIPNSRFQLEAAGQKKEISSQEVKTTEGEKGEKTAGEARGASHVKSSVSTEGTVTIPAVNQTGSGAEAENAAAQDGKDKGQLSNVRRPQFDQYIPEEKEKKQSFGHYAVVADEEGKAKIQFDQPEKRAEESGAGSSGTEEKKAKVTGDENNAGDGQKILKLKNKKKELKQKIQEETDPGKLKELKRKLAQVEKDLKVSGKIR